MSVTPISDKTFETWQAPVSRPDGLAPIIMAGWVTPSLSNANENANDANENANEDIEKPAKKRIKVLPYTAQK